MPQAPSSPLSSSSYTQLQNWENYISNSQGLLKSLNKIMLTYSKHHLIGSWSSADLLTGLSASILVPSQSILHVAARVNKHKNDDITPLLKTPALASIFY